MQLDCKRKSSSQPILVGPIVSCYVWQFSGLVRMNLFPDLQCMQLYAVLFTIQAVNKF